MSDTEQTDHRPELTIEQTLAWADGEYKFKVGWPELRRIESDTERGPMELLLRLQNGQWIVQEISSIMRHSLIGGGTKADKVQKLVATYVESLPPEDTLPLATGLLYMGVFGFRPKTHTQDDEDISADAENADGDH